MADPDRKKADSLIASLIADPFRFDFFAAVRLLQSHFRDLPRIGHSWFPSQDPVRFAQSPAMDFAPSTLEAVQQKDPNRPPVMYVRHFGLFGPNGPLPLCLTEYSRERILHHGDPTFAAFCNVFHHRLLSFFFRAWADARKTVDFDRPTDQHWSQFVGALAGIGMESLTNRNSVPDRSKLYFAGRLIQQSRNAEGLQAIVQDFFGVPAELEDFVGCWLDLPADSVCQLGDSPQTGSLGSTVIVGSRVWTTQLHFRLRLGPMNFSDYERLLPGTPSFRRLCDWVRQYIGDHFSWDAQLILRKEEVPAVRMGQSGRLGWTTWLQTKPSTQDVGDLRLVPPGAA